MPKIFISTAEISAERHAAHLVRALPRDRPGCAVSAAGGALLREAGADIAVDMTGQAVMGFWEALRHLSFYKRAEESILARLEEERHAALVLLDAPSFHLHLARKVRARWPDLPILYYIAPKLWAWKEWRVRNLRRDITRTLCIFPFEVEFFRSRGVDAVFVGNPTLDQLRGVADTGDSDAPERGLLAVFPGSRNSEIKYLWPVMTGAIALLRARFPELGVAVALAPGWSRERLAEHAPLPDGIAFVEGDSQKLLASASVVLAKSGTTTLEAALLGKPMAVTYMGHPASFLIAKLFVKLRHASLPNILSGKCLVNEYLQGDATPEKLAGEIGRLLTDREYYGRMRADLLALRDTLGDEFAATRAAREILSFIPESQQ
jgi:lipid-A-disaccharide synthase